MATFYIDPTWKGTTSGTEIEPFSSWSQVTWTAGNTYLQKRDTTHFNTILLSASGTATSRITLGAYGIGALPIIKGTTGDYGINLGTRSYITIQDLYIISGGGSTRHGIVGLATDALTAHYIFIYDCVVECPNADLGNGIQFRGMGDIIKNCTIRNCVQDGLFLTVSNCLIENCYIHSFDLVPGGDGDGIQFAGTHDYGQTTVRNTRIIGHTQNPIKQCLITAAGSGTFRVEGGEFYGMVTGILVAVPNSVITNVKIWGNTARGITCGANNIVVKSSLIYNTKRGISLDTVTGVVVSNVTVDVSEEAMSAASGAAAYTVQNSWISGNIVAHLLSATATATCLNNRYPLNSSFKINATTYNFTGWQTATSSDAASSEVTPLFKVGYQIGSTSPLLQVGTFSSYDEDANKTFFHNPPSIGAYEYISERTNAGTRGVR